MFSINFDYKTNTLWCCWTNRGMSHVIVYKYVYAVWKVKHPWHKPRGEPWSRVSDPPPTLRLCPRNRNYDVEMDCLYWDLVGETEPPAAGWSMLHHGFTGNNVTNTHTHTHTRARLCLYAVSWSVSSQAGHLVLMLPGRVSCHKARCPYICICTCTCVCVCVCVGVWVWNYISILITWSRAIDYLINKLQ